MNRPGGFTYVELLVALMAASFIMALMPQIMGFFGSMEVPQADHEIDFFILEITETHLSSSNVSVSRTDGSIAFETDRGRISYRKYDSRIIRTVEDSGFVTVMYGADEFSLEESKTHIHLTVSAVEEKTNEAIAFPK